MHFVEQQKNIDCSPTLYSLQGSFVLLHGDIACIRFLAKLVVNYKYFLLFVDLFTSKIFFYPMKVF